MATVAITGAGRGIGFELVKQHLAAGDHVISLVRNPAGATALAALADDSGGRIAVHQLDVTDLASATRAAAASGDVPIDILYNVAGAADGRSDLANIDWQQFDEVVDIGLKGPLRVLQAFLPRLREGSKVINITSQIGASTWPTGGYYAYGATKAALNRLMRSIAVDLKPRGIIIGLVHPGWVQTDMGGPKADLTPEQSAHGICTVARGWTLDRSGDFYKWNGEPHAW
ncbi:short-chain dehydrogenase [Sphingomonas sp. Root710]|uniref:SDR family oxidoreductase n=1 Tax=Sphingomonas sp. Root710 TaxID=1736594 RepID=UPI000701101F|nr:SDR family oxidoreductase [Sphingomonas sp. Root710]KRB82397.1 short-chain dehydrogenase [Sphingomonas sp. Root710]